MNRNPAQTNENSQSTLNSSTVAKAGDLNKTEETDDKPAEIGGPAGLEPTRYGDWEKKGRCIDF
ncbi:MAG: DUF1674 domain-containing protein [Gammaproteobacteria bacterium]|nr:DUF1674 domain-containing protein [Gammaproteobacteria bacterium]